MSTHPTPTCDDDDEHADGCMCGAQPVTDHEATHDNELPAATGGVQGDRVPRRKAGALAKLGEL